MVDVFPFTVGNTAMPGMARTWWHLRELGEAADKYVIGTAEILSSPRESYGNQNKGMRQEPK